MPPPLSPCLFAPMDFYTGFNARWFCCEAHSTLSIDSSIIFMMCKFSQVNFAHFDFFFFIYNLYCLFPHLSSLALIFCVCAKVEGEPNKFSIFIFISPYLSSLARSANVVCGSRVKSAFGKIEEFFQFFEKQQRSRVSAFALSRQTSIFSAMIHISILHRPQTSSTER